MDSYNYIILFQNKIKMSINQISTSIALTVITCKLIQSLIKVHFASSVW